MTKQSIILTVRLDIESPEGLTREQVMDFVGDIEYEFRGENERTLEKYHNPNKPVITNTEIEQVYGGIKTPIKELFGPE